MIFSSRALLCALAVFSILEPTIGRKSPSFGRHSYPKSGGLSGGGHGYPSSGSHGYPSSGSHGYPSSGSHGYPSGGLSGSNVHTSGSSGGSHAYPSSGGLSGGGHGYPSSGSSGYPSSGSSGYPPSKGLSGNTHPAGGHTTNINNHYHYSPPQQIRYTPVHGGAPVSYPVYHGTPPTYVYKYKDSGSKYGTLLTGLALLNLGTLAAGAYAIHSHGNSHYKPQPGELCKFGVKKDSGDYEETKIDCQLISSFILQDQANQQNNPKNTTVMTTTVTNVTTINHTNPAAESVAPFSPANSTYIMFPNGTLVPVNTANNTTPDVETKTNNTMTSSVTTITTTTNTTVTDALNVKGKAIDVTPGMQCYVIRNSPTSNMKRSVPCGLLQTYAEKSLRPNSGTRNVPMLTIVTVILSALIMY